MSAVDIPVFPGPRTRGAGKLHELCTEARLETQPVTTERERVLEQQPIATERQHDHVQKGCGDDQLEQQPGGWPP